MQLWNKCGTMFQEDVVRLLRNVTCRADVNTKAAVLIQFTPALLLRYFTEKSALYVLKFV